MNFLYLSGDSEKAQKIFGYGNYSTLLFEYQNIKIGFMALIDSTVFSRLNATIRDRLKKNQQEDKDELNSSTNPIEYATKLNTHTTNPITYAINNATVYATAYTTVYATAYATTYRRYSFIKKSG
jgi:hypothetical protein